MRPRQAPSRASRSNRSSTSNSSAASNSSRSNANIHQDLTNEYLSPFSSNRAHRRMVQRHRGTNNTNAMDSRLVSYIDASSSRPSFRRGQYRQRNNYAHREKQIELQRQQYQDELLDDLLESDDNKPRKRRVKRSSSGQSSQHGEILVFIRVFVSVILLSAILCVAVTVLFWIMYSIPSCVSSWFGSVVSNSVNRAQLDEDFVQNREEIRHILELARTQYDALSKDNNSLHSVRTEEALGLFELIPHPGNPSIHLSVPRFYASVSVGGGDSPATNRVLREFTDGKMLTPELASIIGPSVSSDADESDPSQRTIFVSILSNSDRYCSATVTNILSTASYPERVRVAIVDVTDTESVDYFPCDEPPQPCDSDPEQMLCKLNANMDVYELRSDRDAGAIFSRHIANRMYRGEYYALQVGYDVSIAFSLGWDEELIKQFEAASNEMAILSTYLSDATDQDREMADAVEARPERITLCHASFEGVMPNRRLMHLRRDQLEQVPSTSRRDRPMLQPYWSAELSFSRGHFILNVPHDRNVCGLDKQDEEISMAVRAFTHGYDFYTPTKSVIFRYPQNDDDKSNHNHSKPKECSSATVVKSRHRLENLVTPNSREANSDVSGLGSVRTTEQFDRCFGIHMKEHITEHRLCEFVVSGNMHDEFIPHLRRNRMGIDYKNINFRFHELISIHKDSEKMS